MLKAEDFKNMKSDIKGVPISITSYKIGEKYFCHVANLDPGATIARSQADTLQEAQQHALTKATDRILETLKL